MMGFTEEDLNCFEKDPFDEWMKVELEEISVSAETKKLISNQLSLF